MTFQQTPSSNAPRPRRKACSLDVWPIHNAVDYDRAVVVVNQLAICPEGSLAPDDQDRLDIFTDLIEAYDRQHYRLKIDHLTPVELVKFLMQEHGMSASDLGRLLGNRQSGHEILIGRRQLSKAQIRRLAEHFHVSPALFF